MATVAADLPRPTEITTVDAQKLVAGSAPQAVDAETGLPKELRAFVVSKDPRMTVVPHFFSDAECDHLLKLVEDYWMPSLVGQATYSSEEEYGRGDLENTLSTTRTSWSCMMRYAQTAVVERLEHRLSRLAGLPLENLERMNTVRYAPGELFDEHHDGKFRPCTIFVYLNELPPDEEDGDTFFPVLGVSFKPRRGTALMWSNVANDVEDSRMLHCARAPRKSVKYGVNCFFNDKPLKQWEDAESAAAGEAVARRSVDPDELLREEGSQALRPGQIHAFTVSQEPRVAVVPGLLGAEEAAALRALAGPPEERVQPSQEQLDSVFPAIERRLAAIAGLPLAHMDPLRVAKCDRNMIPDGQGIAKGDYTKRFGQKVVFVFLNDVPEGGELAFPRLGLEVRPREGCGVVWPVCGEDGQEDLRAAHQGRPPKSGSRYCAFGVFRDAPVRGVPAKA